MQLSAYKINLAKEAIDAKASAGKSLSFFANEKGIPYSSLCRWIRFVVANPDQEKAKENQS